MFAKKLRGKGIYDIDWYCVSRMTLALTSWIFHCPADVSLSLLWPQRAGGRDEPCQKKCVYVCLLDNSVQWFNHLKSQHRWLKLATVSCWNHIDLYSHLVPPLIGTAWLGYCLRYRSSRCPNCRQSAPWQTPGRSSKYQFDLVQQSEPREICHAAMP